MARVGASAWDGALVLAYLFTTLVAAGFFVLVMPPYQNPDEENHFLRADHLSRGSLIGHRFAQDFSGGFVSPEINRIARPFDALKFHPDVKVAGSIYRDSLGKFGRPVEEVVFPNTAVYPPWFYAPAVVAIWAAKASRMDVTQTLYLARFLTALVSCALTALALLVCRAAGASGAAGVIFVVAMLPMAVASQSAVSQDGPMLGTAALAAALYVRLRLNPREPGYPLLCLCLALIATARPPYACIALVPLALPLAPLARLRGAAFVALAAVAWSIAALLLASVEVPGRGTNVGQQLQFLLDPRHDYAVLTRTLGQQGWLFLDEFVGRLGWLDLVLPNWLIMLELGMLLLVLLAGLGRPSATFVAALLLSFVAVFALIYLTYDPVGAATVEGVQGRYFLPLAMLLAGLGTTLARPPIYLAAMATAVVALAVTMDALVTRYYLVP